MSSGNDPHPAAAAIRRLLALGGELAPAAPGAPRRKYELAHMRTLLAALGSPERQFPAVLIAGTNGKGSTAATLASILRAGGTRTGLYTSPHLEAPNERVRVNGVPIPDAELGSLFERVERAAAALIRAGDLPDKPSFFETMTAVGFLHFAASQVGIAVLEVGLGGRLDATNVVEPLLSILTDISLDHMEWLGSTIAEITREKAGILRRNGLLVTLPQHPEANQAIGEAAVPLDVQAINAAEYLPLHRAPLPASREDALRNHYMLALPAGVLEGVSVEVDSPLGGVHQQRNLALAIAAAAALHDRFGFPLTASTLQAGIRETDWPGRLQLLAGDAHHAPLLLDAAHNPAGAWALRAAMSAIAADGPRTLVFGCMADKALDELAQILFPVFDEVLLTAAASPRSASLENLAAAAERTGASYSTHAEPEDALRAARLATPKHGIVVIAGSILLLGQLMRAFHSDAGE